MKSSEALKTISEVSKIIDIPQHVIRFWQKKINKIKPIQKNNGRRYYSNLDIELLKKVKVLLYENHYTIKGVQKYFKLKEKNNQNSNSELINELIKLRSEIKNLL